jgi:hypothetical protein
MHMKIERLLGTFLLKLKIIHQKYDFLILFDGWMVYKELIVDGLGLQFRLPTSDFEKGEITFTLFQPFHLSNVEKGAPPSVGRGRVIRHSLFTRPCGLPRCGAGYYP